MKPAPFTYIRPQRIEDAVAQLVEGGWDAKVIAGGQSLMPMLNLRMVSAERLIDIRRIPQLTACEDLGAEVRIGAGVTHARIQQGDIPDPSNGLMPKVASRIAYQAVRNRGTIGGSLSLADPAADWVTTMAALGATVEWHGEAGPQTGPAEDFIQAAYTTNLGPTDVLTAIRIPRLPREAVWGTYKLCRKTGEFAHAMAMVIRGGVTRAFLGATDGAPIRLPSVETELQRAPTCDAGLERALGEAMDTDIANSSRELADVRRWQMRTCLVRATRMSFGIPELAVSA